MAKTKKNCNKIENTCTGNRNFATCIEYEGTTNEQSPLKDDCSINVEEAIQDIYNQLEETDLTLLGDCLEYVETEEGKIIVKNVLLKHEQEICDLKDRLDELENRTICDLPISECGLDLDCLSLPCDTSIVTIKDLFQALINKVCETP